MIQKILIANWKMNPPTLAHAKKLVTEVKKSSRELMGIQVVIAPPTLYIPQIQKMLLKSKISLGAQNVSEEKEGAQTGEISVTMLKDAGVTFIIVGHSERRARGESDLVINKKVLTVTTEKLTAVLCIGERVRDEDGLYLELLREQIKSALRGVSVGAVKNLVIAYEPIWAIGEGAKRSVLTGELHEMSIFIRKTLVDIYGKAGAYLIPIVYGGSVDETNGMELLSGGAVDGFLVGRASLDARTFANLIQIIKNSPSPKVRRS